MICHNILHDILQNFFVIYIFVYIFNKFQSYSVVYNACPFHILFDALFRDFAKSEFL